MLVQRHVLGILDHWHTWGCTWPPFKAMEVRFIHIIQLHHTSCLHSKVDLPERVEKHHWVLFLQSNSMISEHPVIWLHGMIARKLLSHVDFSLFLGQSHLLRTLSCFFWAVWAGQIGQSHLENSKRVQELESSTLFDRLSQCIPLSQLLDTWLW